MKRLFQISTLVILLTIGVFVLTGCDNNGLVSESALHKISFMDLKYDEVKNFARKENSLDWEENKTLNYYFTEDSDKRIRLIWDKDRDESMIIDEYTKYEEKTINNINWKVQRDTDFGITYDTYSTVHNGDLYIIELECVDKYQSEFDEFMKTVEF